MPCAKKAMDRLVTTELEKIVGKDFLLTDRARIENYLNDESPAFVRPTPAKDLLVVKPADAQQTSAILHLANKHRIPVFPRGGGTGLAGAAVPTRDGIVISMERMNRIEVDKDNMMAVAEAGVTLAQLASAADEAGLAFPPHPGDDNAQVGGLAATNAGGSRAVKHGVMRQHVKGLEVVLPSSEILSLGGKLHKNNVGYDLMQLLIGCEGTLAVITKVTLQLYPKSAASITLIIPYDERGDALASVPELLRSGDPPLAIEYVERDLMEKTARHMSARWPVTTGKCYLIIIIAESDRDKMLKESLRISDVCRKRTKYETYAAESKIEQDNILAIRSNIYLALKNETADILDITVPTAALKNVMDAIDELANRYGVHFPTFGHAGDGNLHIHIMHRDEQSHRDVDNLRDEIYGIATRAGGVITGEHGVGKIRVSKISQFVSERELELMKGIKKTFDPNGILNPGTKVLL
jgi:glycolate oxidase